MSTNWNPPIIDRADLLTLGHRTVSGVLTLVFWALWGYLWMPLLAVLAWMLGLERAYKYMVVNDGWEELTTVIAWYAVVVLLFGGGLVAWATYNIERYGKLPQRSASPQAPLEQVAHYFQQGAGAVAHWRHAQRLYVIHDEKAGIARVEVLAPGAPVPQ
jgi:biofilm PGA synthesis protein PgaD